MFSGTYSKKELFFNEKNKILQAATFCYLLMNKMKKPWVKK
jgi:hypothetical protein